MKMGECTSLYMGIACGVLQGSVLGPKLFNMYVNDKFLNHDDTNIFCPGNNSNDLIVNNELRKLKNWMDGNKLSLNLSKLKVMLFSL